MHDIYNTLKRNVVEAKRGGTVDFGVVRQNLVSVEMQLLHEYKLTKEHLTKLKSDVITKLDMTDGWYEKWKNDKFSESEWEQVYIFAAGGSRNLPDKKEMLQRVSWLVVGEKVLVEGDKNDVNKAIPEIIFAVGHLPIKDGGIVGEEKIIRKDLAKEKKTFSGEMIYEKLLPLMKLSSGGKDCVPKVVTYMLALSRGNESQSELELTRSEIDIDVANLRRNGGDGYFVSNDGTGWLTCHRYTRAIFAENRLGESDSRNMLNINNERIKGGFQKDDVPVKLEEVYRKSRQGRFAMSYNNPHNQNDSYEISHEGTPVFAIRTARKMETKVVRANPRGDFFTDSRYDNVGKCPSVGGTWELIGAHEALVVEYGLGGCLIIDPQTGMLLEVNKVEFDNRVRSGLISFDQGIVI